MIYDVAAALDQGQRDYQEDAVAFGVIDDDSGFVVLADGMGGHEAGDIASRIVVTKLVDVLQERLEEGVIEDSAIPEFLKEATLEANASIAAYVANNRDVAGMGTTLVVPVLSGRRLHWISVGDSPLYVFNNGQIRQVNEDHSMAPQIDLMFRCGMLNEEAAKNHPDRNCLTSVLMGETIPRIDYGQAPVDLEAGDIVIASSDGLQFLEDDQICEIVKANRDSSSEEIAQALMAAVAELNDPDQDNVSVAVIKVSAQNDELETIMGGDWQFSHHPTESSKGP
ncbi:PP2C family protein-serine/threonine phosphatase [Roseovarius aestuarii]|uniref:Serine/threonine phosphatase stp n=1 Tax=Roseovarius aestuarii TaxID=475083 RepID=A0A1X7BTN6_9RHOB|nr:protein phosphatase 2C domain-containing protein [Roseovarius aestuarii]SMC13021.1 Serine/threonine phosphatase stp [Roseovarius aestuarii]